MDSHLPDFRNLLYWSPKIIIGATGKTQAVFYSSDVSGKYAIVIQGISEDGTAGSKVVFFEVKKDWPFLIDIDLYSDGKIWKRCLLQLKGNSNILF